MLLAVGAFLDAVHGAGRLGHRARPSERTLARRTCAAPSPASSISSAISSPRGNATLQAEIAAANGNDYAFALAVTAITVAVLVIVVINLGRERRGVAFGGAAVANDAYDRDAAAE